MKGSSVGYIRVSSVDQNTERQLADVELNKTFTDKLSAKDVERPELQNCIEWIREGDILHVHSIDRLARNLLDLQTLINKITDKGVQVHFHKENLIFEKNINNPMNQLMLNMMGAFAQFERELIRERQREGIAAAKARGVKLGASFKLSEEQMVELRRRVETRENKSAIARDFGISRVTLYRLIK
jgi:DNA invertase Pin-like site-specific DNA recombinase